MIRNDIVKTFEFGPDTVLDLFHGGGKPVYQIKSVSSGKIIVENSFFCWEDLFSDLNQKYLYLFSNNVREKIFMFIKKEREKVYTRRADRRDFFDGIY